MLEAVHILLDLVIIAMLVVTVFTLRDILKNP